MAPITNSLLSTNSVGQVPSTPPVEGKKLDLTRIFSEIGKFVCQVSTLRGKCSGIFLGGMQVLVPFHAIAMQKIEDLSNGRAKFHIFAVEISYQDTTYTARYSQLQNLDIAHYYDCCLFDVLDDDFQPIPVSKRCYDTPIPGEKVYFAGYPLTQRTPSFHKGIVSSVDETDDTVCFHIDAAVLPGSSGGPVFIKRGEQLFLVGVIFAELAHLDSQFVRARQAIQEKLGYGGCVLSGVDVCKVVNDMMDTVFDNLATGIGKVMSLKHVAELTSRANLPVNPSPFHVGFPLVKTEKLPGMLGKDPTYLDWWHRTIKPNKVFCASIVGKSYDAADQIDKVEEKQLRNYYEKNVLNNPQKGHQLFGQSVEAKYRTLEGKILAAKPKALNQHKNTWKTLLLQYQGSLPHYQSEIQKLLSILDK